MKKITLIGVIVIALSAGAVFAQMGSNTGVMGDKRQSMMNRHIMNMPMMSGMYLEGMGMKMVATEDGGIVVMYMGKLYKYDKNLKLLTETEIPLDVEHIKKMMESMQEIMKDVHSGQMSTGSPK
jgi:flagellin-specific chaperone FliS